MRLHCGNCVFDRWPILWTKLSTIRFSKSELSSLMPASSCVLNCERDDFAHLLRFSSFDAAIGFLYCPWYIYFVIFVWFHYFNFAFWINHAITVTIPYPYFNMHPDLDPWPNPSPRGARLVCKVNVCTLCRYVAELLETIRTRVLLKIVRPYTRVTFTTLAKVMASEWRSACMVIHANRVMCTWHCMQIELCVFSTPFKWDCLCTRKSEYQLTHYFVSMYLGIGGIWP